MSKLHIVSCTKKTEKDFEKTPLGFTGSRLGKIFGDDITFNIFTENTRGLCECYNEAIGKAISDDMDENTSFIFVHDDVFIEDLSIDNKLEDAFKEADIIGMAGATKWHLQYPTTWHNTKCEWSGVVPHCINDEYRTVYFGDYSKNCIVLDGLFLACKLKTLKDSGLRFDNRLKFHHYDIDFCLSAKKLGLYMTTAPLWVVHCSEGEWRNDPVWEASHKVMMEKWAK